MTGNETGVAAGVPFTAAPPAVPTDAAPLVVTWHLMDAPCTDAAFAAAVPLAGVGAWRVHFGMPWTGRRQFDGGPDEAARDPMLRYVDPVVRQAADEFPGALAELRSRYPIGDGPVAVVGGSLGGAVALNVLTRYPGAIAAAALVNAAIRARTVVSLFESMTGTPYGWDRCAQEAAARYDFVALAERIAARRPQPPVLVVSGELDFPSFRTDAQALVEALRLAYDDPSRAALVTVPLLAHALAEQPGTEPAPQTPGAAAVDRAMTQWFRRHLTGEDR
jgi:pimeloyl-ACP methyl ester carboxylesterase